MVTFVHGNIFESSAQVITNPVNCVGVMGAGLALLFKNKFPAMFEDYKVLCKNKSVIPGKPYLWENDQVQVLNFPTKRHWQDQSLLKDIEDGLQYLASHYEEMGLQSLALPPLGCGLGGLNWPDVRSLIEKHLGPLSDLEVYVYEPNDAAKSLKDPNQAKPNELSKRDDFAASPS